jgi:hypothetical protein
MILEMAFFWRLERAPYTITILLVALAHLGLNGLAATAPNSSPIMTVAANFRLRRFRMIAGGSR